MTGVNSPNGRVGMCPRGVVILPTMVGDAGKSPAQVSGLITTARKLSGLTQVEVALRVGVDRRSVGEWERTGRVPPHRLDQLRQVYGDHMRDAEREVAPAGRADGDATDPVTIEYRGYRLTLRPREGAPPEEVAKVQDQVIDVVMQLLRGMGHEPPDGGTSPTNDTHRD